MDFLQEKSLQNISNSLGWENLEMFSKDSLKDLVDEIHNEGRLNHLLKKASIINEGKSKSK
tara:strand:- start:7479 stop:7661 length:183 start_codon:yes stop_codon:yes gene_type:complete